METSSLVFITGGVRSGKSTFAEQFAVAKAMETGGNLHYLATGVASDSEMIKRIEKHKKERAESRLTWKTWEQSTHIEELAKEFHKTDILLLDCLTTLVNNELFTYEGKWDESFLQNVFDRILTGITNLRASCNVLILVSNEVLYDSIRDAELVFHYSRLIGKLHQQIVRIANRSYLVECGVPILMQEEM